MTDAALLDRLAALEATEAIRALKARYFACADAKDVSGFRDCFVDGPVAIDYGALGQFARADDLAAVFRDIGCHPHMLEWHHGSNPQIELLDADHARGSWSLHYQLINTRDQTLTQLGGEYADEYRRVDGAWKMSATRFLPRTSLVLQLDAEAVRSLAAGAAQAG